MYISVRAHCRPPRPCDASTPPAPGLKVKLLAHRRCGRARVLLLASPPSRGHPGLRIAWVLFLLILPKLCLALTEYGTWTYFLHFPATPRSKMGVFGVSRAGSTSRCWRGRSSSCWRCSGTSRSPTSHTRCVGRLRLLHAAAGNETYLLKAIENRLIRPERTPEKLKAPEEAVEVARIPQFFALFTSDAQSITSKFRLEIGNNRGETTRRTYTCFHSAIYTDLT